MFQFNMYLPDWKPSEGDQKISAEKKDNLYFQKYIMI